MTAQKKALQMFAQVNNSGATVGVIRIYTTIWGDSWWYRDQERQIRELAAQCTELEVRIHTFGGDVFNAIAIHNLLKSLSLPIKAYIDGVCASAGTIIACAANQVYMYELGFYMIHLPTISLDNVTAEQAASVLNMVETFTTQAVKMYAKKTGLAEADIRAMMTAETWMDSTTALSKKFIDGIQQESPMMPNSDDLQAAMQAGDKVKLFNCFQPKMAENLNQNPAPQNNPTPPATGGGNTPPLNNAGGGMGGGNGAAANYFNMLPIEVRNSLEKNAHVIEKLVMLLEKHGDGEVNHIAARMEGYESEIAQKTELLSKQEEQIKVLNRSIRVAKVTNAKNDGRITAQEAELFLDEKFPDANLDAILGMRKPAKKLTDALSPSASMVAGKTYEELLLEDPSGVLLANLRRDNPAEYERLENEAKARIK